MELPCKVVKTEFTGEFHMFLGRQKELAQLNQLFEKNIASFVCVLGRRRIGKSTLIHEFAKPYKNFIRIQGLAPSESSGKKDQLDHFSEEISSFFDQKKLNFNNWEEAFVHLAENTRQGKWIILLDEISWMAQGESLFSSILKDKWDHYFKKNNQLVFIVCGSVSAWIEDNIQKNTNFVGRISLNLKLEELSLEDSIKLLKSKHKSLSTKEVLLALSITGGVPKYLEEVANYKSLEKGLLSSCFNKGEFFYEEYDRIFTDIFGRRKKTLERILKICLEEKPSPSQLAKKLKIVQNSELTEQLHILEQSGFICRDYYFKTDSEPSRHSRIRISDNFIRFYLKYISPLKLKIEKGSYSIQSWSDLKNREAFFGYLFENLVLNNKHIVHEKLSLNAGDILSSAPYMQKKNTINKQGCQIDLLVQTKMDIIYVCEIKFKNKIDKSIIPEVEKKIKAVKFPRYKAIKPVLIFKGEINPADQEALDEYFVNALDFIS